MKLIVFFVWCSRSTLRGEGAGVDVAQPVGEPQRRRRRVGPAAARAGPAAVAGPPAPGDAEEEGDGVGAADGAGRRGGTRGGGSVEGDASSGSTPKERGRGGGRRPTSWGKRGWVGPGGKKGNTNVDDGE